MAINSVITPVEVEGRFYIDVTVDGCELKRQGPYDAGGAEAAARKIAGVCQVLLHQPARIDAPAVKKRA